jgi:heavy metal sensor kinase
MNKILKNLTSIRWRLTLWFTLTLALALVIFSLTVYFAMYQALNTQFEATLHDGTRSLGEYLEHEFEEGDSEPVATNGLVKDSSFRNFAIEVYSSEEKLLAASERLGTTNLIGNINLRDILTSTADLSSRETRDEKFDTPDYKIALIRVTHPKTDKNYVIVVGAQKAVITDELATLKRMLLLLSPLLLILSAGGGFYLARRALKPVAEMTAQARRMNANRLSERLSIGNAHDELGQLGTTFNELFERIETAFAQMRQFIADASHELRTPVAVIRSETDVALTPPRAAAESYRSLEIIQDEAIRLSRLVEDMFTLARADADDYNMLESENVALGEIVETCARSAETLGRSRNVEVEVSNRISSAVTLKGDRIRIAQMILNILDNATKYTQPGGTVKVTARVAGDSGSPQAVIEIEDNGPGISDEFKDAVFDRFYRLDRARTRSIGGSGLGLPIARSIAEAHQGKINLSDSKLGGAHFSITIPITIL